MGMWTSCTLSPPVPYDILVLGQAVSCYIFTVIISVNTSRVADTRAVCQLEVRILDMEIKFMEHRINTLLEIKCQTIKYYM